MVNTGAAELHLLRAEPPHYSLPAVLGPGTSLRGGRVLREAVPGSGIGSISPPPQTEGAGVGGLLDSRCDIRLVSARTTVTLTHTKHTLAHTHSLAFTQGDIDTHLD